MAKQKRKPNWKPTAGIDAYQHPGSTIRVHVSRTPTQIHVSAYADDLPAVYGKISRSSTAPGMWDPPQISWEREGPVSCTQARTYAELLQVAIAHTNIEFSKVPTHLRSRSK